MKVWLLVLALALACCPAPAPAATRAALEPARADASARYSVDKGWTYFDRGDLRRALRLFQQTAQADPGFAEAYGNLAVVYWSQGKAPQAAPFVRRSLELAPQDPMVQENAAYYYFAVANYQASWRHLEQARKLGARPDPAFVRDVRAKLSQP